MDIYRSVAENTFRFLWEFKKKMDYNFNPYAKRLKYGNQKTVINGIVFDSKKESERYLELAKRGIGDLDKILCNLKED